MTNLSANHLDRYESLEEYYADKALLFRNADAGSVWVTNADQPDVQQMVPTEKGPTQLAQHPGLDTSGSQ